jgi:hypothetical protein
MNTNATPAPETIRPAVVGRVRRVREEMAEYERQIERCRRNLEDDFYPYLTDAERAELGLEVR